jgi:hypothetical protein
MVAVRLGNYELKVGIANLQGLGFTTNNDPIFYKHLSRRLIADIIAM